MKKFAVLTLTLFLAAVSFAAQETLNCGNKTVTAHNDGRVVISNSNGEIVTVALQYVLKNAANGEVDWFTVTPALCKMQKDGNKVVWELWKKHALQTWKIADQSIELLEDGTLQFAGKSYTPEGNKLLPRIEHASFFITFPTEGNAGEKFLFNDDEHKLDPAMKSLAQWNGKRFDYDLFIGNKEKNVTIKSVSLRRTGMLVFNKQHRIMYDFKKDNTCAFLIDLHK